MKRLTILLSAILAIGSLSAQRNLSFEERARKEFEQFKQQNTTTYDNFRQKANATYAEFLKHAWHEMGLEQALEPPKVDPPVQPVAPPPPQRDADKPIDPKPLVFKGISRIDPPKVTPFPRYDIPEVKPEQEPFLLPMPFTFFGESCTVRLKPGTGEVKLPVPSNQNISNAWKELSDGRYDAMFADCMAIREKLKLNDWGYFQLSKRVAEEYCEAKNSNNSKILQAFLMTQAGYKIRMGRYNDKLFLLFPCDEIISGKCFIRFNDNPTPFYLLDEDAALAQRISMCDVCDAAFPGEMGFSIDLPQLPELPFASSVARVHKAARYPDLRVDFEANKNLVDFFNTYPQAPWKTFALGSLSEHTKQAIYPILKKAIAGKDEIAAANILINFVQTGFQYKTDGEQFGRERSLFGDESLYYPFCDCEDRAILFSILMRDLLGLKAALIHYPGHLATAICFSNGKVYGDYIEVGGNKYTICDPTYIGANVGMTMPNMNNAEAEVILI